MFKVIFLNLSFLILCFSCSKGGDSSTPVPELKKLNCVPEEKLLASGIVGGVRVSDSDRDSKNVMMLFSDGELCTASAISPRVLITAAHCVKGTADQSWVGLYSSISCESGFDIRNNTVKIKEFVVHPEYSKKPKTPEFLTNDIALVFLEDSLPSAYPIYRIADSGKVNNSNSIYFWGYGLIGSGNGGAGILRKTQLDRQNFEILSERKKVKIDQSAGHGLCNGDSGGPGLVKMNDELQILGINSYVEGFGTEKTLCANKAYLTLADAFLPWINSNMLDRNEYLKQ